MTSLPQQICIRLLADVASALRPSIGEVADPDTLHNIDQSIKEARAAADGELPRPDLGNIANAATQLTGKVELYSQGLFLDDADRESALGRLSSEQMQPGRDVADITARALRAATGDESDANIECQEGLSWAFDMAERLGDDVLTNRLQLLVDNAMPH